MTEEATPEEGPEADQLVMRVERRQRNMVRLDQYDGDDKRRIKAIACKLIEGRILRGKLECTDEAIRAAMPQAIEDARQVVTAVGKYLCG